MVSAALSPQKAVFKGVVKILAIVGVLWFLTKWLVPGAPDYRGGTSPRIFIWVAAELHLMFAAFVLGVPIFAVVAEVIGVTTKDERYDRLAYEFTKLLFLAFTITAVLGAGLFIGLIAFYPKFYAYMSKIFGDTYYVYIALLLSEAIYAYLYYYTWEALKDHKWFHIGLGVMLNVAGTAIMFVANSWGSFMMSPAGMNAIGQVDSLWAAFSNLTWMPLNIHRIIGNIAFGGLIVGAYAAVKFLQAKTDEERAHYDWMGYTGNFIGMIGMIPMPFAGYYLAREIYEFDRTMGVSMMGGLFSWLFIIQAVLIGLLFLAANYYIWIGMRRIEGGERFAKYQLALLGILILSFVVWMTPRNLIMTPSEQAIIGTFHPIVKYFGLMSGKLTVVNLIILSTFISFLLYQRANKIEVVAWAKVGKLLQGLIFLVASTYVIYLGVKGYTVPDEVRINIFSVRQVLVVLAVLVSVTVIDIFMFRNARKTGEIQWGKMPPRSQYALILLAVSVILLMGLMGYIRSGLRQEWHVSAVVREGIALYPGLRDQSAGAFTPSIAYATKVIALTSALFIGFVMFVFWLGGRTQNSAVRIQKSEGENQKPEGHV